MEQVNIEEIVKQVLSEMKGSQAAAPAKSAAPAGAIPKTSRVAMLTGLEHYDIKEYPIPELGDDDILVKVEGCGVCGTDAHEFKSCLLYTSKRSVFIRFCFDQAFPVSNSSSPFRSYIKDPLSYPNKKE